MGWRASPWRPNVDALARIQQVCCCSVRFGDLLVWVASALFRRHTKGLLPVLRAGGHRVAAGHNTSWKSPVLMARRRASQLNISDLCMEMDGFFTRFL
jgi:hypothetical protein